MKKDDALRTITKATHLHQDKGLPIHLWPDVSDNLLDPSKYSLVSHFMSTETFSVHEDDNAQLALEIMLWNNIHHLPVVNTGGELVGLLTWSYLERYKKNQDLNPSQAVKDIMIESPIIVQSQTTLDVAIALLNVHSIGCLPVVDEGILVGILTKKDLEELANDRSTQ
jgi:CBS domain-containing protein